MNACTRGHQEIEKRRLNEYDASGLLGSPFPVILHNSADEKYCSTCDERISVVLPNWTDLVAMVAVSRAIHPCKLTGAEIKFLRKSLSRKAKEFAEELALSPEQYSRFENDKQPISEVYERLLRASVCLGHFDQAYRLKIDVRELLAMRIKGVRPCEESFEVQLELGESGKSDDTPLSEPDLDNIRWKRQA
jgi:transcriptional regulator with XRE-family HTH domain